MNILIRRRTTKAARMATAMLLLIALLSNSLLFAQAADESTGFSFAISGTTFTVTPGGATLVIDSNGDGSVEIATVDEAVIWANLGGAGSGRLTDDQITGVTAGVSYAISGNTLTFMDADGGEIYQFTVRDNSASGTPVADGSTKTYDFTDGSVVSKLYDAAYSLDTVTSADGLLTITGGNGSYWHDSQHGIVIAAEDTISVKVAGNATVDLTLCVHSDSAGAFTVNAAKQGTLSTTNFSAKSEYFSDTPSDGKSFLVLFFEVENVSNEDDYFNYFNIESYVDGYNTPIKLLLNDPDGIDVLTGDVAAGKKLKGHLAWEVSPGWKELEVSYKDNLWTGGKAATFRVVPSDLTA